LKPITLTETEITHILDSLDERVADLHDTMVHTGAHAEIEDLIHELTDLSADLHEHLHRWDDDWDNDAVPSAALDMMQAGIDAREQVKATSMAAQRREKALSERLMEGTTGTLANDPIDW